MRNRCRGFFAKALYWGLLVVGGGVVLTVSGGNRVEEGQGESLSLREWRGAAPAAGVDFSAVKVGSFRMRRAEGELFWRGIAEEWRRAFGAAADDVAPARFARERLYDEALGREGGDFREWLSERGGAAGATFLQSAADYYAEAALEYVRRGARGVSSLREFEADFRSSLGGREWNAGFSALGALRETPESAWAWQLRTYAGGNKASGANAGLLYRRAFGEGLVGGNVFLDYENLSKDPYFFRWSLGFEYRSQLIDLFVNRYEGISDPVLRGGNYVYTKDGEDVEVAFRLFDELPVTGAMTYYRWEGEFGALDESGVVYHLRFGAADGAPGWRLELAFDDARDGETDYGGRLVFAKRFGVPEELSSVSEEEAEFDAAAFFFASARREYGQRIGRVAVSDSDAGGGDFPRASAVAGRVTLLMDGGAVTLEGGGGEVLISAAGATVNAFGAEAVARLVAPAVWEATVWGRSSVALLPYGGIPRNQFRVLVGALYLSRVAGAEMPRRIEAGSVVIVLRGTALEVSVDARERVVVSLDSGAVVVTVMSADPAALSVRYRHPGASIDLVWPDSGSVAALNCAGAAGRDGSKRFDGAFEGCAGDAKLAFEAGATVALRAQGEWLTIGVDGAGVHRVLGGRYGAAWGRYPFAAAGGELRVLAGGGWVAEAGVGATVRLTVGGRVQWHSGEVLLVRAGAVSEVGGGAVVCGGELAARGEGRLSVVAACGEEVAFLGEAGRGELAMRARSGVSVGRVVAVGGGEGEFVFSIAPEGGMVVLQNTVGEVASLVLYDSGPGQGTYVLSAVPRRALLRSYLGAARLTIGAVVADELSYVGAPDFVTVRTELDSGLGLATLRLVGGEGEVVYSASGLGDLFALYTVGGYPGISLTAAVLGEGEFSVTVRAVDSYATVTAVLGVGFRHPGGVVAGVVAESGVVGVGFRGVVGRVFGVRNSEPFSPYGGLGVGGRYGYSLVAGVPDGFSVGAPVEGWGVRGTVAEVRIVGDVGVGRYGVSVVVSDGHGVSGDAVVGFSVEVVGALSVEVGSLAVEANAGVGRVLGTVRAVGGRGPYGYSVVGVAPASVGGAFSVGGDSGVVSFSGLSGWSDGGGEVTVSVRGVDALGDEVGYTLVVTLYSPLVLAGGSGGVEGTVHYSYTVGSFYVPAVGGVIGGKGPYSYALLSVDSGGDFEVGVGDFEVDSGSGAVRLVGGLLGGGRVTLVLGVSDSAVPPAVAFLSLSLDLTDNGLTVGGLAGLSVYVRSSDSVGILGTVVGGWREGGDSFGEVGYALGAVSPTAFVGRFGVDAGSGVVSLVAAVGEQRTVGVEVLVRSDDVLGVGEVAGRFSVVAVDPIGYGGLVLGAVTLTTRHVGGTVLLAPASGARLGGRFGYGYSVGHSAFVMAGSALVQTAGLAVAGGVSVTVVARDEVWFLGDSATVVAGLSLVHPPAVSLRVEEVRLAYSAGGRVAGGIRVARLVVGGGYVQGGYVFDVGDDSAFSVVYAEGAGGVGTLFLTGGDLAGDFVVTVSVDDFHADTVGDSWVATVAVESVFEFLDAVSSVTIRTELDDGMALAALRVTGGVGEVVYSASGWGDLFALYTVGGVGGASGYPGISLTAAVAGEGVFSVTVRAVDLNATVTAVLEVRARHPGDVTAAAVTAGAGVVFGEAVVVNDLVRGEVGRVFGVRNSAPFAPYGGLGVGGRYGYSLAAGVPDGFSVGAPAEGWGVRGTVAEVRIAGDVGVGRYEVSVVVFDEHGASGDAVVGFSVEVVGSLAVAVGSLAVEANAGVGRVLATVQAVGGRAPYAYSVVGVAPASVGGAFSVGVSSGVLSFSGLSGWSDGGAAVTVSVRVADGLGDVAGYTLVVTLYSPLVAGAAEAVVHYLYTVDSFYVPAVGGVVGGKGPYSYALLSVDSGGDFEVGVGDFEVEAGSGAVRLTGGLLGGGRVTLVVRVADSAAPPAVAFLSLSLNLTDNELTVGGLVGGSVYVRSSDAVGVLGTVVGGWRAVEEDLGAVSYALGTVTPAAFVGRFGVDAGSGVASLAAAVGVQRTVGVEVLVWSDVLGVGEAGGRFSVVAVDPIRYSDLTLQAVTLTTRHVGGTVLFAPASGANLGGQFEYGYSVGHAAFMMTGAALVQTAEIAAAGRVSVTVVARDELWFEGDAATVVAGVVLAHPPAVSLRVWEARLAHLVNGVGQVARLAAEGGYLQGGYEFVVDHADFTVFHAGGAAATLAFAGTVAGNATLVVTVVVEDRHPDTADGSVALTVHVLSVFGLVEGGVVAPVSVRTELDRDLVLATVRVTGNVGEVRYTILAGNAEAANFAALTNGVGRAVLSLVGARVEAGDVTVTLLATDSLRLDGGGESVVTVTAWVTIAFRHAGRLQAELRPAGVLTNSVYVRAGNYRGVVAEVVDVGNAGVSGLTVGGNYGYSLSVSSRGGEAAAFVLATGALSAAGVGGAAVRLTGTTAVGSYTLEVAVDHDHSRNGDVRLAFTLSLVTPVSLRLVAGGGDAATLSAIALNAGVARQVAEAAPAQGLAPFEFWVAGVAPVAMSAAFVLDSETRELRFSGGEAANLANLSTVSVTVSVAVRDVAGGAATAVLENVVVYPWLRTEASFVTVHYRVAENRRLVDLKDAPIAGGRRFASGLPYRYTITAVAGGVGGEGVEVADFSLRVDEANGVAEVVFVASLTAAARVTAYVGVGDANAVTAAYTLAALFSDNGLVFAPSAPVTVRAERTGAAWTVAAAWTGETAGTIGYALDEAVTGFSLAAAGGGYVTASLAAGQTLSLRVIASSDAFFGVDDAAAWVTIVVARSLVFGEAGLPRVTFFTRHSPAALATLAAEAGSGVYVYSVAHSAFAMDGGVLRVTADIVAPQVFSLSVAAVDRRFLDRVTGVVVARAVVPPPLAVRVAAFVPHYLQATMASTARVARLAVAGGLAVRGYVLAIEADDSDGAGGVGFAAVDSVGGGGGARTVTVAAGEERELLLTLTGDEEVPVTFSVAVRVADMHADVAAVTQRFTVSVVSAVSVGAVSVPLLPAVATLRVLATVVASGGLGVYGYTLVSVAGEGTDWGGALGIGGDGVLSLTAALAVGEARLKVRVADELSAAETEVTIRVVTGAGVAGDVTVTLYRSAAGILATVTVADAAQRYGELDWAIARVDGEFAGVDLAAEMSLHVPDDELAAVVSLARPLGRAGVAVVHVRLRDSSASALAADSMMRVHVVVPPLLTVVGAATIAVFPTWPGVVYAVPARYGVLPYRFSVAGGGDSVAVGVGRLAVDPESGAVTADGARLALPARVTLEVTDAAGDRRQHTVAMNELESRVTISVWAGLTGVIHTLRAIVGEGPYAYSTDSAIAAVDAVRGVVTLTAGIPAPVATIAVSVVDAVGFARQADVVLHLHNVGGEWQLVTGSLYFSGGHTGFYDTGNDFWVLNEAGTGWDLLLPSGHEEFTERRLHAMLSYRGTLYVIGGNTIGGSDYGSAWSSPDGVRWTELVRRNAVLDGPVNGVVFRRRMIIVNRSNNRFNVYESQDGKEWNYLSSLPRGLSISEYLALAVMDGQLFAYYNGKGDDRVFSSSDAVNWRTRTLSGIGLGQAAFDMVNFNARLMVISQNDVYFSDDGVNWEAELDVLSESSDDLDAVFYDGKVYVVGDDNLTHVYDGISWSTFPSFGRRQADMVVFSPDGEVALAPDVRLRAHLVDLVGDAVVPFDERYAAADVRVTEGSFTVSMGLAAPAPAFSVEGLRVFASLAQPGTVTAILRVVDLHPDVHNTVLFTLLADVTRLSFAEDSRRVSVYIRTELDEDLSLVTLRVDNWRGGDITYFALGLGGFELERVTIAEVPLPAIRLSAPITSARSPEIRVFAENTHFDRPALYADDMAEVVVVARAPGDVRATPMTAGVRIDGYALFNDGYSGIVGRVTAVENAAPYAPYGGLAAGARYGYSLAAGAPAGFSVTAPVGGWEGRGTAAALRIRQGLSAGRYAVTVVVSDSHSVSRDASVAFSVEIVASLWLAEGGAALEVNAADSGEVATVRATNGLAPYVFAIAEVMPTAAAGAFSIGIESGEIAFAGLAGLTDNVTAEVVARVRDEIGDVIDYRLTVTVYSMPVFAGDSVRATVHYAYTARAFWTAPAEMIAGGKLPFRFELAGGGEGFAMEAASGALRLTAAAEGAGAATVVVRVTDSATPPAAVELRVSVELTDNAMTAGVGSVIAVRPGEVGEVGAVAGGWREGGAAYGAVAYALAEVSPPALAGAFAVAAEGGALSLRTPLEGSVAMVAVAVRARDVLGVAPATVWLTVAEVSPVNYGGAAGRLAAVMLTTRHVAGAVLSAPAAGAEFRGERAIVYAVGHAAFAMLGAELVQRTAVTVAGAVLLTITARDERWFVGETATATATMVFAHPPAVAVRADWRRLLHLVRGEGEVARLAATGGYVQGGYDFRVDDSRFTVQYAEGAAAATLVFAAPVPGEVTLTATVAARDRHADTDSASLVFTVRVLSRFGFVDEENFSPVVIRSELDASVALLTARVAGEEGNVAFSLSLRAIDDDYVTLVVREGAVVLSLGAAIGEAREVVLSVLAVDARAADTVTAVAVVTIDARAAGALRAELRPVGDFVNGVYVRATNYRGAVARVVEVRNEGVSGVSAGGNYRYSLSGVSGGEAANFVVVTHALAADGTGSAEVNLVGAVGAGVYTLAVTVDHDHSLNGDVGLGFTLSLKEPVSLRIVEDGGGGGDLATLAAVVLHNSSPGFFARLVPVGSDAPFEVSIAAVTPAGLFASFWHDVVGDVNRVEFRGISRDMAATMRATVVFEVKDASGLRTEVALTNIVVYPRLLAGRDRVVHYFDSAQNRALINLETASIVGGRRYESGAPYEYAIDNVNGGGGEFEADDFEVTVANGVSMVVFRASLTATAQVSVGIHVTDAEGITDVYELEVEFVQNRLVFDRLGAPITVRVTDTGAVFTVFAVWAGVNAGDVAYTLDSGEAVEGISVSAEGVLYVTAALGTVRTLTARIAARSEAFAGDGDAMFAVTIVAVPPIAFDEARLPRVTLFTRYSPAALATLSAAVAGSGVYDYTVTREDFAAVGDELWIVADVVAAGTLSVSVVAIDRRFLDRATAVVTVVAVLPPALSVEVTAFVPHYLQAAGTARMARLWVGGGLARRGYEVVLASAAEGFVFAGGGRTVNLAESGEVGVYFAPAFVTATPATFAVTVRVDDRHAEVAGMVRRFTVSVVSSVSLAPVSVVVAPAVAAVLPLATVFASGGLGVYEYALVSAAAEGDEWVGALAIGPVSRGGGGLSLTAALAAGDASVVIRAADGLSTVDVVVTIRALEGARVEGDVTVTVHWKAVGILATVSVADAAQRYGELVWNIVGVRGEDVGGADLSVDLSLQARDDGLAAVLSLARSVGRGGTAVVELRLQDSPALELADSVMRVHVVVPRPVTVVAAATIAVFPARAGGIYAVPARYGVLPYRFAVAGGGSVVVLGDGRLAVDVESGAVAADGGRLVLPARVTLEVTDAAGDAVRHELAMNELESRVVISVRANQRGVIHTVRGQVGVAPFEYFTDSAIAEVAEVDGGGVVRLTAGLFAPRVTVAVRVTDGGGMARQADVVLHLHNVGGEWQLVTGSLYFGGGFRSGAGSFGQLNDLWVLNSAGTGWNQVLADGHDGFTRRYFHVMMGYRGALYVIGGIASGGSDYGSAWSSPDGVRWTELVRKNAVLDGVVKGGVFKGRMVIIRENDRGVYESYDGKNWRRLSTLPRNSLPTNRWAVAAMGGRLFVYSARAGMVHSIFSSSDAIAWSRLDSSGIDFIGNGFAMVSFNEQLMIISQNDAYFSDDGVTWEADVDVLEHYLSFIDAAFYDGKVYVSGGNRDLTYVYDGLSWRTLEILGRSLPGMAVFSPDGRVALPSGTRLAAEVVDLTEGGEILLDARQAVAEVRVTDGSFAVSVAVAAGPAGVFAVEGLRVLASLGRPRTVTATVAVWDLHPEVDNTVFLTLAVTAVLPASGLEVLANEAIYVGESAPVARVTFEAGHGLSVRVAVSPTAHFTVAANGVEVVPLIDDFSATVAGTVRVFVVPSGGVFAVGTHVFTVSSAAIRRGAALAVSVADLAGDGVVSLDARFAVASVRVTEGSFVVSMSVAAGPAGVFAVEGLRVLASLGRPGAVTGTVAVWDLHPEVDNTVFLTLAVTAALPVSGLEVLASGAIYAGESAPVARVTFEAGHGLSVRVAVSPTARFTVAANGWEVVPLIDDLSATVAGTVRVFVVPSGGVFAVGTHVFTVSSAAIRRGAVLAASVADLVGDGVVPLNARFAVASVRVTEGSFVVSVSVAAGPAGVFAVEGLRVLASLGRPGTVTGTVAVWDLHPEVDNTVFLTLAVTAALPVSGLEVLATVIVGADAAPVARVTLDAAHEVSLLVEVRPTARFSVANGGDIVPLVDNFSVLPVTVAGTVSVFVVLSSATVAVGTHVFTVSAKMAGVGLGTRGYADEVGALGEFGGGGGGGWGGDGWAVGGGAVEGGMGGMFFARRYRVARTAAAGVLVRISDSPNVRIGGFFGG